MRASSAPPGWVTWSRSSKVDDGVELEEVEGFYAEALLAGTDVVPGVLA